jgi:hypothetical protein
VFARYSLSVTPDEIFKKIQGLSPEERETLRREMDSELEKTVSESATPETVANLHREQQASNDERGLPIEDVLEKPTPKEEA